MADGDIRKVGYAEAAQSDAGGGVSAEGDEIAGKAAAGGGQRFHVQLSKAGAGFGMKVDAKAQVVELEHDPDGSLGPAEQAQPREVITSEVSSLTSNLAAQAQPRDTQRKRSRVMFTMPG